MLAVHYIYVIVIFSTRHVKKNVIDLLQQIGPEKKYHVVSSIVLCLTKSKTTNHSCVLMLLFTTVQLRTTYSSLTVSVACIIFLVELRLFQNWQCVRRFRPSATNIAWSSTISLIEIEISWHWHYINVMSKRETNIRRRGFCCDMATHFTRTNLSLQKNENL